MTEGSFTPSAGSAMGVKNPSLSLFPATGPPLPCRAEPDGTLYFDPYTLFSLVGAVGARWSFSSCHPLW